MFAELSTHMYIVHCWALRLFAMPPPPPRPLFRSVRLLYISSSTFIFRLLDARSRIKQNAYNNNSNRQVVTLLPRGACHFIFFFFYVFYSLNLSFRLQIMKKDCAARPFLFVSVSFVRHCFHSLHYYLRVPCVSGHVACIRFIRISAMSTRELH